MPASAQEEPALAEKKVDTIALKSVNIDAINKEKTTSVQKEEQSTTIQKSIKENQKEAEKIKAKEKAIAKDLEKEQSKLEKEQNR